MCWKLFEISILIRIQPNNFFVCFKYYFSYIFKYNRLNGNSSHGWAEYPFVPYYAVYKIMETEISLAICMYCNIIKYIEVVGITYF